MTSLIPKTCECKHGALPRSRLDPCMHPAMWQVQAKLPSTASEVFECILPCMLPHQCAAAALCAPPQTRRQMRPSQERSAQNQAAVLIGQCCC